MRTRSPIEPWLSGQRFSYIFMDCRGYGGMREARGAYTMDEIAADALALADALGYPAFSLIGHSMGGMASERIATLAPERVLSMLAVAPVPCGGMAYDAATRRLLEDAAEHVDSRKTIINRSTGGRYAVVLESNGRRPIRRRAPLGKHSPPICARGPTPISASGSAAGIR